MLSYVLLSLESWNPWHLESFGKSDFGGGDASDLLFRH
jgi:hypothetical protein